jgi:hypothetical protein
MMSVQAPPAESHRRHWYAYESGGVPDQPPALAVNVCPACAVPEILGKVVFAGGAAATTAVGAEVADVENAFDAVTTTRRVEPTSAGDAVYVLPLAFAMSEQLPPSAAQRRHW